MARSRKAKPKPANDSSSFSSSDSDCKGDASIAKRKKCKKKGSMLLLPFLFFMKGVRSCVHKAKCGEITLSPFNPMCLMVYIPVLLLAVLLYFYGGTLWAILKSVLPSSWFKSTSTIVDEALARYNADKLGLPDYALESAGGSVLCSSNTYYSRNGPLYSIFGVPLWYHSSSPREVIQPDVQPGKCWAMDRNRGYVMIRLSMPVIVTAVSLEHIPAQVAPTGRIDSAPRDFVIVGKESTMDSPDVILGNFRYNAEAGNPIQTFSVKDAYCLRQTVYHASCGLNTNVFRIIELRITSNHGNPDYTCIYRFRVHGKPLVNLLPHEQHSDTIP